MNYNKLENAILESVNKVKSMNYIVLYAANYGSHNYNLDINNETYQSDIDTKVIILPTLEELVRNSKPISTTYEISTGLCDVKDIRAFVPTLLKANIQFLEILDAKAQWINPLYKDQFQWFIDNLPNLIDECKNELLKSVKGMCYEKRKALCHPYPTTEWKINKWGYDGKQLHHIIRLKDFIDNYFYNKQNFKDAIWYKDDDSRKVLLMDAKLNKLPLKQAQDMAELFCEMLNREVDRLTVETKEKSSKYKDLYREKANEIIIENIKRKILEEN